MTITVADIYRYPVKGLTAERLDRVTLTPGEGLPHDRRFAIAQGSVRFDPKDPQWLPKTSFLMLMRDEKLAQLNAAFDPESGCLTIERNGKQVVRADVTEPLGRTVIAQFFASFMAGSLRGTPRVVEAAGHMFSDSRHRVVSLINLPSLRDLERVVRRPVDPLRFRANFHIDGAPAWSEFHWIGQDVEIGGAGLRIEAPIERCAATNVDPRTAERDLNIPLSLQRGFGHMNLGVYGRVVERGEVATGDGITTAA